MRLYYNGEITYKPMLVWMVPWKVNEHYWTRCDMKDPEVSPLRRIPSNLRPQNHGWVEQNISTKESQRVLCQLHEGQRNPEWPETGIHSGWGQPPIFFLNPAEGAKDPEDSPHHRIHITPKIQASWDSGSRSELQTSGHLPCIRRAWLQRVLWPLWLRWELDYQDGWNRLTESKEEKASARDSYIF